MLICEKRERWLVILRNIISKYPGIPRPPKLEEEVNILMDKIRETNEA